MILNYHFNGFEDIFLLIDNVNIFENYIGKQLKNYNNHYNKYYFR